MCNDVGEGSRCCAFYSFVGTLFTLWVGILVHTQPFYIAGMDDPDEVKASAFGAMAMFAATFLVSLAGIYYDSLKKNDPDSVDGSDAVSEGYQLNTGDAPGYGT